MINQLFEAIHLVLFDVDDTLLYTAKNGWKKMNAVAEILKRPPLSKDEFFMYYGVINVRECVKNWFPNNSFEEVMYYYGLSAQKIPYEPICDFNEIQKDLCENDIACGILTNGHENDALKKKLKIIGADIRNLRYILGRESLNSCKPDGAVFNVILQDGWDSNNILYVGDAYTDWQATKNANINFLGVCTGITDWTIQKSVSYINSVCDFKI